MMIDINNDKYKDLKELSYKRKVWRTIQCTNQTIEDEGESERERDDLFIL